MPGSPRRIALVTALLTLALTGSASAVTAKDEVGGHDGTYAGGFMLGVAGAVSGESNRAARFDGFTGRVQIPDLGAGSTAFTVEGWQRMSASAPAGSNQTLYGGTGRLRLLPRPTGVYAGVTLGGTEYAIQNAANLADNRGRWVHWALVRDGSALRVYRNAVQVAARSDLPATAALLTGTIARQDASYPANAEIDEVAVYDAALTAAQVRARVDAARGRPGTPQPSTTDNKGVFTLTWQDAPGRDSGLGAVTYELQRSPAGGGAGAWKTVGYTNNPTWAFTAEKPEDDGIWIYRVRAFNQGDGAVSDWSINSSSVLSFRTGPTYSSVINGTTGVRGYWRLNDPSGSTAQDEVANRHGTYTGGLTLGVADALSNDANAAVRFGGVNGRVQLPDLGAATSTLTVEGWQRMDPSVAAGSNHALFGGTGRLRLLPRPSGVYAGVTVGGVEYALQPSTADNRGRWVHWALVRDGSSLRLFRNGVQLASRNDLPPAGSLLNGTIGAQDTSYPAKADIDEVAVYEVALTAAQIKQHLLAARAAPGAPVTTQPTNAGTFELTWDPAPLHAPPPNNNVRYEVQRAPDGTAAWTTIGTTSNASFGFNTLNAEPEGAWIYRVRSVNESDRAASDWSAASAPVTVTHPPADYAAPVAPSTTTPTNGGVFVLTWNHNAPAGATFELQHAPSGTTNWTRVALDLNSFHEFTATARETHGTWIYRVRTINTNGRAATAWSDASAPVTVAPPAVSYGGTILGTAGLRAYWRLGDVPPPIGAT